MKKLFFSLVALVAVVAVFAQTQQEAFKDLLDGRVLKAQKDFENLVAKEPGNAEFNYWLGQIYLMEATLPNYSASGQQQILREKARAVYTKAMTSTNQNPLILVGMGHLDLLDGKNAEARAKFDQAILATANKKNKKYGDPAILNAIVRANASGDSKTGDATFAIEKATQSEELLGATPDMFTNLGVIYLKGGGENGGLAKRAFEKALDLDPNFAPAYWRVGRIFESQKNPEMFLGFYEKAIGANPKFAPAYLSLYQYYSNRDVNKAKQYLDFYIANADKDRETDYFYADYLFRAGQYQESLNKGKEIEAALAGDKYPKVYKLYAYNYDRLKDSVNAMNNMEKYMNEEAPERISGDDYAFMAASYLKVPGNTTKAEVVAEKAIESDTSVVGRVAIMESLANSYSAQGDWKGTYKWLARKQQLKPDNSARNFYFLADAAHKAKEFKAAQEVASQYIATYPDQPQGYFLKWRSAIASDPDTSTGLAIPVVDEYTAFLMKDTAKNKGRIIQNHGYKVYYYLVKVQDYPKALESANAILAIDPTNNYGAMAKSEAERLIKATGKGGGSGASKAPAGGSATGAGGRLNPRP
ncbi:MAG TPA: tetratricopeptide repeat protein [Phnomibacter sp.]|nr:tetratricopeptide repeat protein [Phnomibacter sp.]